MIRNHDTLARSRTHRIALHCVVEGIEAAQPGRVVRDHVALETNGTLEIDDSSYYLPGYEEVVVVGTGKAAAHAAAALEDVLGTWLTRGAVVTNDPVETETVDVIEASHPVPDERGREGAARIRETVADAHGGTFVLAVFTGGGSALLPAPAGDIPLADLQEVTEALVESGASIDEINAVRKHCSAVKGGQLARTADPAPVCTILFSDVVGDDPSVIASGPTTPDETTYGDALAVLDAYAIDAPASVRDHLEAGRDGERAETPGPGNEAFEHAPTHVLANAWTALDAAREAAIDVGFRPLVLSSRIEGEAREVATTHASIATEARTTGHPVEPPAVILSGGETTVTVEGDGRGGPNTEFALSAARSLPDGAVLASVDTDGEDGASGAAGAIVDGETVDDRAAARAALHGNDAASYLADRDALVETGPTGTNVNDLRVVVVPTAD